MFKLSLRNAWLKMVEDISQELFSLQFLCLENIWFGFIIFSKPQTALKLPFLFHQGAYKTEYSLEPTFIKMLLRITFGNLSLIV